MHHNEHIIAFVTRNEMLRTKLFILLCYVVTKYLRSLEDKETFQKYVAELGIKQYLGITALEELVKTAQADEAFGSTEVERGLHEAAGRMMREEVERHFGDDRYLEIKLEATYKNRRE